MANAKRRRTQSTADDDFDILLSDALGQLLPARHVLAGASWYFRTEGDRLIITRSVPTTSIPDPDS
jgi:hypothetical protein